MCIRDSAFGNGHQVSGSRSLTAGLNNFVSGVGCVVFGSTNRAQSFYNMVFGRNNYTNASSAGAIGRFLFNRKSDSIALGVNGVLVEENTLVGVANGNTTPTLTQALATTVDIGMIFRILRDGVIEATDFVAGVHRLSTKQDKIVRFKLGTDGYTNSGIANDSNTLSLSGTDIVAEALRITYDADDDYHELPTGATYNTANGQLVLPAGIWHITGKCRFENNDSGNSKGYWYLGIAVGGTNVVLNHTYTNRSTTHSDALIWREAGATTVSYEIVSDGTTPITLTVNGYNTDSGEDMLGIFGAGMTGFRIG